MARKSRMQGYAERLEKEAQKGARAERDKALRLVSVRTRLKELRAETAGGEKKDG